MTNRIDFFSNQDAAGNSSEFASEGGDYIFAAEASSWGGASVKLQAKGPNGTMIDVTSLSLSANGFLPFTSGKGEGLRAVVTGTPTDLYCAAYKAKPGST